MGIEGPDRNGRIERGSQRERDRTPDESHGVDDARRLAQEFRGDRGEAGGRRGHIGRADSDARQGQRKPEPDPATSRRDVGQKQEPNRRDQCSAHQRESVADRIGQAPDDERHHEESDPERKEGQRGDDRRVVENHDRLCVEVEEVEDAEHGAETRERDHTAAHERGVAKQADIDEPLVGLARARDVGEGREADQANDERRGDQRGADPGGRNALDRDDQEYDPSAEQDGPDEIEVNSGRAGEAAQTDHGGRQSDGD